MIANRVVQLGGATCVCGEDLIRPRPPVSHRRLSRHMRPACGDQLRSVLRGQAVLDHFQSWARLASAAHSA
jgi:hypothetical protein